MCRSTTTTTCAGYCTVARLWKLLEKLDTAPVSLYRGSGRMLFRVMRVGAYLRTAAAVVLSNVACVLVVGRDGHGVGRGDGVLGAVMRRTFMVCPGEMTHVLTVKGLTQLVSASTTL
jgi:hypothetical protein